jgi:phage repressor protein C with HTH and peptisase S24 domain
MGWALKYIEKLKEGKTVSFRPRGNSMSPRIKSGQLCIVQPVDVSTLQKDDIVLCRVRGMEYLHLIKSIQENRFQIGNNHGNINGWIGASSIFGRLIRIEK